MLRSQSQPWRNPSGENGLMVSMLKRLSIPAGAAATADAFSLYVDVEIERNASHGPPR